MKWFLSYVWINVATFYDRINTIYRFINPFSKMKYLFLRNMEPFSFLLPILCTCPLIFSELSLQWLRDMSQLMTVRRITLWWGLSAHKTGLMSLIVIRLTVLRRYFCCRPSSVYIIFVRVGIFCLRYEQTKSCLSKLTSWKANALLRRITVYL